MARMSNGTGTEPERDATSTDERDTLVSFLRRLVSAGGQFETSAYLKGMKPLEELAIVDDQRARQPGVTVRRAVRVAVEEVINGMSARETATDPHSKSPRNGEALKRLFGYSPTTTNLGPRRRKEECWHYLHADPMRPEAGYHSVTWYTFIRHKYPELLNQLANEILAKERATHSAKEISRTSTSAEERTLDSLAEAWKVFYWLFRVDFHLQSAATAAGLLIRYQGDPSRPMQSLTHVVGELLSHVMSIWRAVGRLEHLESLDPESSYRTPAAARAYLEYRMLHGGAFKKYHDLSQLDRQRIGHEFDHGLTPCEMGERLTADPDGRLVLDRYKLLLGVCQCTERSSWRNCPLHTLLEDSRSFGELLRNDWYGTGGMSAIYKVTMHVTHWSDVPATARSRKPGGR